MKNLLIGSIAAASLASVSSFAQVALVPSVSFTETPNAVASSRIITGTASGTFNYVSGSIALNGNFITVGNTRNLSYSGNPSPFVVTAVKLFNGATEVATGTLSAPTVSYVTGTTSKWAASAYTFSFSVSGLSQSAAYTLKAYGTLQSSLGGPGSLIATTQFTTPVPEPETYAVAAALGLVGFGIWRRRA